MYDMSAFGRIIAELRKKKGMTQEELGGKLNITAQAVSKWENGVGYPDISVMPRIAEVLDVDMDTLFGVTDKDDKRYVTANLFDGLPLVHENGRLACYSDKEVKNVEDTVVHFADGSVADLSTRVVKNYGTGECRIAEVERVPKYELRGNRFENSYGVIESLKIEQSFNADVTVKKGDREEAVVIAEGSELFIATLRVTVENCKMRIYNENLNGGGDSGYRQNKLKVYTGFDKGKTGELSINGCGNMELDVGFDKCRLAINGSGCIRSKRRTDGLTASINGSGDMELADSGETNLQINGSGDIGLTDVDGNFTAKINGSGDISARGNAKDAVITVNGSGDMDLKNMTVRVAKVNISGAGDIVLGRVTDHTEEKLTKNSTFKVLQRG
ncbi:MAG: helix-turn-helix domain-containing protein [Ruminococcaceae bacterium]|nr:helix-turn-helix domain-containing protein [Oscillospiraceae bacterium]